MKKGITPIIAIVILLLIAIAIAGAAYSYITGYWSGLTAETFRITGTNCNSNGNVSLFIQNTGSNTLTIPTDIDAISRDGSALDQYGDFDYGNTTSTFTVDAYSGFSMTSRDTANCVTGSTCSYDIVIGGLVMSQDVRC